MAEIKEWKKPNQLEVPESLKHPDFGNKFCSKANLGKRTEEGWEIVDTNGKPMPYRAGVNLDGAYHVRELILCRMPKHMIKQRNDFYQAKADRAMAAIKRGTEMNDEVARANKEANKAKGTDGQSFVQSTGRVSIRRPVQGQPVQLEPMLDEKQVEEDLKSIDK